MKWFQRASAFALFFVVCVAGCLGEDPQGLHRASPAATTVAMDFFHRPLPEIPLPNDIATRTDLSSATGRRVNASMVAPTGFERRVRELIDSLDGWGVLQPIAIPFTGPLDIQSILDAHRDADYDLSDDVIYLIDIDRDSPDFGRIHHLDLGNGNFPVVVEEIDGYWKNDPRGWICSIMFEEEDEDLNGNGVLDQGEDTDSDGLLDVPNYLPGADPNRDDLAARADALMSFYERETNTLIAKPLVPLRERTTYAVVVTRRLLDADGQPVGSPYEFINHAAQTEALTPLLEVLPEGLGPDDIAFAFSYTTQSIESHWQAVRDGLYGHGVQRHLGEDFPADVAGLEPLRDDTSFFPNMENPHILWVEDWLPAFELIQSQLQGADTSSVGYAQLLEAAKYVDYFVIGRFESPQLFEREDGEGNWLPLNDQSWPADLDLIPAPARSETVYFYLAVPRPEVSARGQGEPAPVVILGHGYGGNRFDVATFAGFFARRGMATIAVDNVSHGLGASQEEYDMAVLLLGAFGLESFANAAFLDRAFDHDGDGGIDSGADFWTAYLFHTRDVVRQSALDYMQLIRILRAFDGERLWQFDLDGDGVRELAGDFDGDGTIDVGGSGMITMTGGSLGGMMTAVMGGLEPEISAVATVVGGGGLGDLGIRSLQGGVREAFIMPVMGPLYAGTVDLTTGDMLLEAIPPNINKNPPALHIATVPGVAVGDTVVAENLSNGERGCGVVSAEGTVRTAVPSDMGDRHRVLVYAGDQLVLGNEECEVVEGAAPKATVDTFELAVEFHGETHAAGGQLQALGEGLGLRRGHPDIRRFGALGQLVLDPGDPAVYARHMLEDPLTYPGTGQTTGAHALLINTVGDMGVPAAGGMMLARSAGLLDYLEVNPDHGVPNNQVLIDTYTAEGVNTLRRFVDPDGNGVHMDVDNWSDGNDLWPWAPRLDPPVRSHFDREDALGGRSGFTFMYGNPQGSHGTDSPGGMIDKARAACEAGCESDDCGCDEVTVFDTGNFLFGMISSYLSSGGTDLFTDACLASWECDDVSDVPTPRRNPDGASSQDSVE